SQDQAGRCEIGWPPCVAVWFRRADQTSRASTSICIHSGEKGWLRPCARGGSCGLFPQRGIEWREGYAVGQGEQGLTGFKTLCQRMGEALHMQPERRERAALVQVERRKGCEPGLG